MGRVKRQRIQSHNVFDANKGSQQIFLGTLDKVYVVDKTENNPTQINGHPTWAAEFSVSAEQARPMDIITNSFCAVSRLAFVVMHALTRADRVVAFSGTEHGSTQAETRR